MNGHLIELFVVTTVAGGISSRVVCFFPIAYRLFILFEPSTCLFHCRLLEYSEEMKKALEESGQKSNGLD